MQASLSNIVGAINTALWSYLLIYALIGIGLFFTVYLGAPQITKFGAAFKSVFGGLFAKKEKDAQSLSQFQALAVAISAQIGTGNVAGVATAIVSGGPGAIFWMWVSAFLGMGTIFAEALLSCKLTSAVTPSSLFSASVTLALHFSQCMPAISICSEEPAGNTLPSSSFGAEEAQPHEDPHPEQQLQPPFFLFRINEKIASATSASTATPTIIFIIHISRKKFYRKLHF